VSGSLIVLGSSITRMAILIDGQVLSFACVVISSQGFSNHSHHLDLQNHGTCPDSAIFQLEAFA